MTGVSRETNSLSSLVESNGIISKTDRKNASARHHCGGPAGGWSGLGERLGLTARGICLIAGESRLREVLGDLSCICFSSGNVLCCSYGPEALLKDRLSPREETASNSS